jgi:hypothetical protein
MNTSVLTPPPPAPVETPDHHHQRLKKSTPPLPARTPTSPIPEAVKSGGAISGQTKIIVAHVNVGWGNTVYIRGEGGCLNWDLGLPMMCTGEDRWVWCCHDEEVPRQFKFLRNDQDWALGDNQVMSGADITVCNPLFSA